MSYKTPGVYVEEISLLPPSVAQVETAIPAFIGYTKKGPEEATKVTSMLEYEEQFGGPHHQSFEVTLDDNAPFLPQSVAASGGDHPYLMHSALQMFFANGGGVCYIVSAGNYKSGMPSPDLGDIGDYNDLKKGLNKIRKVDEVTLIVIPEAIRLIPNEHYDLCKDVLIQCGDLQDRFGIFDLRRDDNDGSSFRNGSGTSFLSYGAAYYPYLKSSLKYSYEASRISFKHGAADAFNELTLDKIEILAGVLELQEQVKDAKQNIEDAESTGTDGKKEVKLKELGRSLSNAERAVNLVSNAMELVEDESFTSAEFDSAGDDFDTIKDNLPTSSSTNDELNTALTELSGVAGDLETAMTGIVAKINTETGIDPARNSNIGTYFTNEFRSEFNRLLNKKRLILPPSSTIAGVYAKVDGDRGVWKSPANVSLNRVSGPDRKITIRENNDFNVHATGKSINVIRSFTGKGTLVWGARTLDGNSNEWKYISVRRFFMMVEESVKKASEPFVFEPNNANTWVKVKAMIENFLVLQWRAGALMGAKPDEAFFVKVGLGETMTQQNVLDGEMIVEIGMAVVRPAEFIILRFTHHMLES